MKFDREYFKKSFSWKKCMHFVGLGAILALILTLWFVLAKPHKDANTPLFVQNLLFIIGITMFAYCGIAWIAEMGFLFSLFKNKDKYKKENDISKKITEEKQKPASKERAMRLRILNDELAECQKERREQENIKRYNFVLIILSAIAIIILIACGILAAVLRKRA